MTRAPFGGRDRRAVAFPGPPGVERVKQPRTVAVVGGGIAGMAAACGLAERGVDVELIEPHAELGGRVRAWQTNSPAGAVTMSRGFHAFFRQYYNLRALLSRAGDLSEMLQPVADYPVVSAHGDRDSFTKIPRTPPWNFMTFVAQSPTFSLRDLTRVDLDTALALLDVSFPESYRDLQGLSAAQFLDKLRFPERARHLALEVFARSFFADPEDFSAGELVAMFHSYFLGSAEGLLFDVARDDFDTALWQPLGSALERAGVRRSVARVSEVRRSSDGARWQVIREDGERSTVDGVVLAAGPGATRDIVAASSTVGTAQWRKRVADVRLAPAFAVLRLWLDGKVSDDRPAFLGTAAYGPLDNISVMERFERGAAEWSAANNGSVVELHAYAIHDDDAADPVRRKQLGDRLRAELARVYPETASLSIIAQEFLIEQDCALLGTGRWEERPEVRTPASGIVLAGDWVRTDLPIALMERAATTGWMAANELLRDWGVAGHTLWSVPISSRQRWPGISRALMERLPGRRRA
ncbi:FAD-dependent oxidoreductase [Microbacterium sp. NC79]|uniref:FAD-dependent oxidoreductase n=1 Tax=Microbacterium sp. NC79 TaxID=2851009 RepID=UPI001C2C2DF8|nr:FAD-dependent oxidoreductase [Microbacterium sp. NC79]MBV0895387.1 FAD-dependent oxidoreductase [Microbacterium sp. NC79]